jgi:hypothetical protein
MGNLHQRLRDSADDCESRDTLQFDKKDGKAWAQEMREAASLLIFLKAENDFLKKDAEHSRKFREEILEENNTMREVLTIYADGKNWFLDRMFDPNSSNFKGEFLAQDTLNKLRNK